LFDPPCELKDRLPKTIAIGETNFNAKLRKNFAGVLIGGSGKQARENLVGLRLLTPHAPSGVRTHPAVENYY